MLPAVPAILPSAAAVVAQPKGGHLRQQVDALSDFRGQLLQFGRRSASQVTVAFRDGWLRPVRDPVGRLDDRPVRYQCFQQRKQVPSTSGGTKHLHLLLRPLAPQQPGRAALPKGSCLVREDIDHATHHIGNRCLQVHGGALDQRTRMLQGHQSIQDQTPCVAAQSNRRLEPQFAGQLRSKVRPDRAHRLAEEWLAQDGLGCVAAEWWFQASVPPIRRGLFRVIRGGGRVLVGGRGIGWR